MADTKEIVKDLINNELQEDTFLVELKVLPGNNIKVFLDADSGITIDKCIKINRAVYRKIEEAGLFPNNDFSLEVSSPGIDEPLKLQRQYKKNIGRQVEVTLIDDTKKQGKLLEADDNGIVIEEKHGHGKKQEIKTINILSDQIRQTKVLVTF